MTSRLNVFIESENQMLLKGSQIAKFTFLKYRKFLVSHAKNLRRTDLENCRQNYAFGKHVFPILKEYTAQFENQSNKTLLFQKLIRFS